MMRYAADAAKYYQDIEIIERHSPQKLDSPSGTSIKTAELISEARKDYSPFAGPTKELLPGARGATHCDVPIHSLRLPGSIAHQTVVFGAEGETFSIHHDTMDRESFMPGVIFACRKVLNTNSLIYGFEHLLD